MLVPEIRSLFIGTIHVPVKYHLSIETVSFAPQKSRKSVPRLLSDLTAEMCLSGGLQFKLCLCLCCALVMRMNDEVFGLPTKNPFPSLSFFTPVNVLLQREVDRHIFLWNVMLSEKLNAIVSILQQGKVSKKWNLVLQIGHSCII